MNSTIRSTFWSDPDVEAAPAEAKLAMLWLVTNPQTNLIGLCKVSPRRFTFETGLSADWMEKTCGIIPRNVLKTQDGIWLRKYITHQFGTGEKLQRSNCIRPIFSALANLRDPMLRAEIATSYPELTQPDAKGMRSPLEGAGEGFRTARPAVSPPAPIIALVKPVEETIDRELSAEEIAASVAEIFGTKRRANADALHRIFQAMPVFHSEIEQLKRFYSAPKSDAPGMARCETPTNLAIQLADQLVKAKAFCEANRPKKAHLPPATIDEMNAWLKLKPEYSPAAINWTSIDKMPTYAADEFLAWRRKH